MNPKEKAEELILKFMRLQEPNYNWFDKRLGKQCALIAVDEILNSRPLDPNYIDWDDCGASHQCWYEAQKEEAFVFWVEVKNEIGNI